LKEVFTVATRIPTQNSGAAEERKQILDHVRVLQRQLTRSITSSMTAEQALDDVGGFIQSRTERTRARKGGLSEQAKRG
jgi:hypothetical protein